MDFVIVRETDHLEHHGIKGQKWGVRRWQNDDGTYNAAGRERYGIGDGKTYSGVKDSSGGSSASPSTAKSSKQPRKKGLTDKQKKVVKTAAVAAGAVLAAYGTYKAAEYIKSEAARKATDAFNQSYDQYKKVTLAELKEYNARIAVADKNGMAKFTGRDENIDVNYIPDYLKTEFKFKEGDAFYNLERESRQKSIDEYRNARVKQKESNATYNQEARKQMDQVATQIAERRKSNMDRKAVADRREDYVKSKSGTLKDSIKTLSADKAKQWASMMNTMTKNSEATQQLMAYVNKTFDMSNMYDSLNSGYDINEINKFIKQWNQLLA